MPGLFESGPNDIPLAGVFLITLVTTVVPQLHAVEFFSVGYKSLMQLYMAIIHEDILDQEDFRKLVCDCSHHDYEISNGDLKND
jgi:hypothetical protein